MVDTTHIISFIILVLLFVNIICALIYSILILLIRRFRHPNNIFIFNICLSIIGICIYSGSTFLILYFDPQRLLSRNTCQVLYFTYNIASTETPLAFIAFSIHRLCSLVYHTNIFFKTKRWVTICITSQWIVVCLISLPFLFRQERSPICTNERWMRIYTLIMAVFIPSMINIVLNIQIFNHVRASSSRVRPQLNDSIDQQNTIQQPRINPRDIALLRQIIFMFFIFLAGWTPVYFSLVISEFIYVDPIVPYATGIWSSLSIFCVVINLFVRNHELKQYLQNKRQQIFRRT